MNNQEQKLSITILSTRYQHVRPFWFSNQLISSFWRFYYNESKGSFIQCSNHEKELTPDSYYLIPPATLFQAREEKNPRQLYIHFYVTAPYASAEPGLYSFSLPVFMRRQIEQIHKILSIHVVPDGEALLRCSLLCSRALLNFPKEKLTVNVPDKRVFDAIRMIEKDFTRPLRVEKLADQAGMTRSAFIRLFKKISGITPHKYITRVKIRYACNLLSADAKSIDEIANEAAYTDRFHFSKIFKQETGMTPAEFRLQHKE